jgi:MoxR-like ATPase
VIEQVLLTLFVGGNSLLVGVPGLAKTLLIHTIAQVLDLKFSRIQFTPDLMPSDITGTDIIQEDAATGRREMVFAPGPVFANIVLADEINRTPPKTQAALLEAMQEHRVTVQGRTYKLEEPFYVFATQNPDRAGGHLSPPRGPARPLHVRDRHRAPEGGGGARGHAHDDGHPGPSSATR